MTELLVRTTLPDLGKAEMLQRGVSQTITK